MRTGFTASYASQLLITEFYFGVFQFISSEFITMFYSDAYGSPGVFAAFSFC